MLTQQQVKLVKSISKKLSEGYHISKIEIQTFIQKMQQQNPFTQLQDYFDDQIQSFVLKARTTREKRGVTTKQVDCIQEQLKDSIDIMKKEYELLICEKLIAKINHQNLDCSHYGAQSQLLKAEASQGKREITSVQPIYSNEEIKYSIGSLLKEQENVNRCLAKAWHQLYLAEEYEEKKIGMPISSSFEVKSQFLKILTSCLDSKKMITSCFEVQDNMKGIFEEIIKNKNDPNQHVKNFLAIQKLDAFNFKHSKNILHRGIDMQNLLIQQINRLYDIGLASVISILRSQKNLKKSIQTHFTYEVEKEFSRIQVKDNLQVFRLVTLELDNQNILQRQSILHEELTEIYQEIERLSKFQAQLTPKSNILKTDQANLVQNYQKTRLNAVLSNILNKSKHNKRNVLIYSAILLDLMKEQSKIIIQFYKKKQVNKYLQVEEYQQLIQYFEQYIDSKNQNRSFEIIGSRIKRILLSVRDFKIFQDIMVKMQIAETTAYIENAQIDPNYNKNKKYIIKNYSQIYKNIKKFLIQETQKRKNFQEFANQNSKQKLSYPKSQQSIGIQLLEQEKLIITQQTIHQDIIFEKEIKSDFNCIQIKLLGGSEKQKIQGFQLDEQQIQCNQNQSEDINFKRIKIEDQLLIEQIQNSISKFEHMQTQSEKQVEKPQQNENQQFQESKNQNQNQSEALITQTDNSKIKILEQDQTFKKGMVKKNEKVQIEVNIESNQNKNQNQNYNEIEQFNVNEIQNYNQNLLEEQTTKTDNGNQKILYDLPFKNGVGMEAKQANVYEIVIIESISKNQNENKIDLISKVDKSKQILKIEEYEFLRSIFNLGDYIISGGEADIFINSEKQVAFRVIKINDETLKSNLSELDNIKQFKEVQHVLDLQASHIIENKLNKQKYIIHAMQICQYSLWREYKKIDNYNLDQILNIIFTCLHFLIQLRQKYMYHSDIKPANILKIHDQYKLSDFGASKEININNPYVEADMYTPNYKPKNKVNKKLPFYHDIYSVAKTIEVLLNKFQTHEIIKNKLKKQIEELLKDDKNSIEIDCFKLPNKFIDCLIDQKDSETIQFLERYLVKIEDYLIINKENKIFKYESQFQYAEIALKILKIENLNENIQINKIKLKALQTKSYILIKKGKYQKAFECIKEILNSGELNSQETLISSIITLTKILIKKNQMRLSKEIYQSLMEFIQKNNKFEQILELQIKLFDIQLNSSNEFQSNQQQLKHFENQLNTSGEFQSNQQNFYNLLENIDQSKRLEIIYKLAIKCVKYLKLTNTYVDQIDELINFIKEDQSNSTSYYRQKLIKKTCLYLYQLFFKNIILDIEFYWNYRNQIQNLIKIVYNYLLSKQDQKLEVCFDEDIQDLCLILVNLKEIGFFDQEQIKEIDKLIQKYYDIFYFEIKPLPYYEQQYQHDLKSKFRQKYEQIKKLSSNIQKDLIPSAGLLNATQNQSQQVNEQIQKILKVLNSTTIKKSQKFQQNQIEYFDCDQFNLNFIGTQSYFEQNFDSFSFQINGQGILNYYLKESEKDICLTLNFDDQSDTISYFIKEEEQNQISFEIKFNPNNKLNSIERIFKIFNTADLERFKVIRPINIELNQIGEKGAQSIGSALEKCQNISQLNLDLSSNQIGEKGAQSIGNTLEKCQNITHLNLYLVDNNIIYETQKQLKERLETKFKDIKEFKSNIKNNLNAYTQFNIQKKLTLIIVGGFDISNNENIWNNVSKKQQCIIQK
ncbi:hypothetical protein ABPG74_006759 [Tetrahymena malaccensis]